MDSSTAVISAKLRYLTQTKTFMGVCVCVCVCFDDRQHKTPSVHKEEMEKFALFFSPLIAFVC